MLVLFVLGVALSMPFLGSALEQDEMFAPMAVGLGVWLSVFLTALVPFDFRGDIDRMAALKTLPIAPWPPGDRPVVDTGCSAVHDAMAGAGRAGGGAGSSTIVLVLAAYVPPFNFVLVALDNLLFLLFPVRLAAATPGDFQALGRTVLLSLGKVIGLGVASGMAVLVGLGVAGLTGRLWAGRRRRLVGRRRHRGRPGATCRALAFRWFDLGREAPARALTPPLSQGGRGGVRTLTPQPPLPRRERGSKKRQRRHSFSPLPFVGEGVGG